MERMGGEVIPTVNPCLTCEEILELRRQAEAVHVDPRIKDYILDLVVATRPGQSQMLSVSQKTFQNVADELVEYGASPRASLGLLRAARAMALLKGRTFVIPDDVRAMAVPVLAHRLIMTFEAEAKHVTGEKFVEQLLDSVVSP